MPADRAARSGPGARTCVGCGLRAAPARLRRVSRAPDGTVGAGRHRPGRGAWCCGPECLERAIARGGLARALRATPTDAELAELRAKLMS